KPDPAPPRPESPVVMASDDLKVWFPIKRGLLRKTVGHIKAVDGVSVSVRKGETLGVVGESGSGKSTMARAVTRLMPNVAIGELSGRLTFDGRDILGMPDGELRRLRRGRGFSMIFQDPLGYLNPTQR
ncbi:ATP-binding cassette domain-containing protein, partial [Acinetobacter baumannii]